MAVGTNRDKIIQRDANRFIGSTEQHQMMGFRKTTAKTSVKTLEVDIADLASEPITNLRSPDKSPRTFTPQVCSNKAAILDSGEDLLHYS